MHQESYCELLVAWKEELTRPLREAKEFLTTVELQLNSITNTGTPMGALISAAGDTFSLPVNCLNPSVNHRLSPY